MRITSWSAADPGPLPAHNLPYSNTNSRCSWKRKKTHTSKRGPSRHPTCPQRGRRRGAPAGRGRHDGRGLVHGGQRPAGRHQRAAAVAGTRRGRPGTRPGFPRFVDNVAHADAGGGRKKEGGRRRRRRRCMLSLWVDHGRRSEMVQKGWRAYAGLIRGGLDMGIAANGGALE